MTPRQDRDGTGDPPAAPPARTTEVFTGLFLLTVVTGIADATSFLGLGNVFTANMTGNVLLLGFSATSSPAARLERLSLPLTATALGAFVVGALLGAATAGRRGTRPRLALGFWVQWVLLATVVLVIGLTQPTGDSIHAVGVRYAGVVLLGLAMGVQNAVVRRMGLPDVNTTVLTTALGGLAADVVEVGGRPPRGGRRLATVAFLFAGAAAGAGFEQFGVVWAALAALVTFTAGFAVLVRSRTLAVAQ